MEILVKGTITPEPAVCGANLCPANSICVVVACGLNAMPCGLNACGIRI